MIQQLFTVAGTLTGFIIGYGFKQLTKKFKKKDAYPEIEITDYHYTNIWEDI
jgi:multisubunit Na+/H+ antiporter MnhE subunit